MPECPRWLFWSLASPGISCKLQNMFQWFSKVSWIARRSKITLLKFDNSWNVFQASKYFSMIFKSLFDCQKVQDNFPEVWQVLECLASFKIFFYDFQKSPGLLEGPRYLSWRLARPGMSCKLQKIFLWYLKVSRIARRSKNIFLNFGKSWNVLEASKYFSMIFKSLLDCQKVQDNISEVLQVLECLVSFRIFFYDF